MELVREAPAIEVLLLTPSVEGTGGAERSMLATAPYYREAGLHLTVVVYDTFRTDVEVLEAAGAEVVDLAGWGSRAELVRSIRRVIRERRPDVLHTLHTEADIMGRLAALGTGIPVMTTTAIVPLAVGPRDGWRRLVVRALDAATARWACDHVHAVTPAVRETAIRRLCVKPERVTVVERGREDERLGRAEPERRREARARLGVGDEVPLVVAAGRHYPAKNHGLLLDAIGRLQRERPDLVLALAGRVGPETAEIERHRATLPRPDDVLVLGHRTDVYDLIAAADVFVCSSSNEGAAGAVVEALGIGVPVVCTRAEGGLQGLVEDGRDLLEVPNHDVEALAAAVARVLDDPELATALAAQGRRCFEEQFRLEVNGPRLVELTRSVAQRRVPGRWGRPVDAAAVRADTIEFYDRVAPGYDRMVGGVMGAETALVERFVRPEHDVLDLGVGSGRTTPALTPRPGRYLGIDLSPGMVAEARSRHPGEEFRVGDATDLADLDDGSFDVVLFSFNGLDTLRPVEMRAKCLAEVRRILRPDGVFLFSCHHVRAFVKPLGRERLAAGPLRALAVWGYTSLRFAAHRVRQGAFWRGAGYELDIVHRVPMYGASRRAIDRELSAAGFERLAVLGGEHPRRALPVAEQLWYYAYRPA